MARTIVGGISATQENVTLSAGLTAVPGDLFKIDNEVVEFGGYGSIGRIKDFTHKRVIFHRGMGETAKATHSNGASVFGIAGGLVAGSSEALPSPIVPSAGQASNANLTAFAGLTLIADRLPYANGSGTLALATLTAAGRAIIDDADSAAQRATLGVPLVVAGRIAANGTVAGGTGFTSSKTDTGKYTVTTPGFGATPAITVSAVEASITGTTILLSAVAAGSFSVTIQNTSGGVFADAAFHFIAVGI